MLNKILFFGSDNFFYFGVQNIIKILEIHIPKKFLTIIIIDVRTYRHYQGQELAADDTTLVILLLEHEHDIRLFQTAEKIYHIVYLVSSCKYDNLLTDLRSAFINSERSIYSTHNRMYKKIFSVKERMIINMMMNNYSPASISAALNLPIKTIYNNRAYIMRKLNVNNKVEMYNKIQAVDSINNLLCNS